MRRRLLFAVALACACAGEKAYLISPGLRQAADRRVAVLPFDNNSAEPGASAALRALAAEGFSRRGYPALSPAETDGLLRGLARAGGAASAAETGRALGVGLLCYGSVEDFSFENLGLAVKKSVRLRLKIVSVPTGEVLFISGGAGGDFRSFHDQEAARTYYLEQGALGGGEGPAQALRREARAAADEALDRLPRGRD
ncbi:MAG TPA: hypothetical protein PKI19_11910 [Elusimicrobiales bacterium]|nr:hypothetical protein [Elusimicrobiales bacterium]